MRGGDGRKIPGESPDESARASSRGTAELEIPGHRGRGTDISNGLTGQGRPAELPGGGMPGPSNDEDGDAGVLPAPAFPRQCGHSRVGKPTPPMMHRMRHAGPPAGAERKSPCHRAVRQGSGAEEVESHGGIVQGDLGEGL